MVLAFFLAILIGLALGSLGSGGSMITLPVMVHLAGVAPKQAVGMSLVVVAGTSLLGAILHFRNGNFHPRAALLFAAGGVSGAYFGATGTHLVQENVLMLMFASLMLMVSLSMFRARPEPPAGAKCSAPRCLAIGFCVGLLTGFLGVGGGFLIVPTLILLAGVDTKRAIGSSLAVSSVNSSAGVLGHLRYTEFDIPVTLLFLAAALIGMTVGVGYAQRLSARTLRVAFASLVLALALGVGTANLMALLG